MLEKRNEVNEDLQVFVKIVRNSRYDWKFIINDVTSISYSSKDEVFDAAELFLKETLGFKGEIFYSYSSI